MGKMFAGKNGGLLQMTLGVLGLVLWTKLFQTILAALVHLAGITGIEDFIAMDIGIQISGTVLFLAGIFGAGWLYVRGYKQSVNGGINGLLLMVAGALEIILFVTMFAVVVTNLHEVLVSANVTYFIALTTVVGIAPIILFLGGLFAGGATMVGGNRQRKKGSAAANAV